MRVNFPDDMTNQASGFLQLGHAARRAGRAAEALDHYRSAIEQEPGSAEAHSVYGLMLLHLGRAAEAEAPLRKAVEIAPRHPALRMNLAEWLADQGKTDEATRIVVQIVEDEPHHWWAWERLGALKARVGDLDGAAACLERAIALKPQEPSLLYKLAEVRRDGGRAAEAERILARAESAAQARLAILREEARFHEANADWVALENSTNAWVAAQPRDPEAWRARARAQSEAGYYGRAMESFRHALALGERDARNLATYGKLCIAALEFGQAAEALDEAEAIDPGCALLLSTRASLLMIAGRYDEATIYCRRAIQANRIDVAAYKTLVQLTDGRLSKQELAELEKLVGREDLRPADRVAGAFALADCRHAQGEGAGAFAAYERANRLAREVGAAKGIFYDAQARRARTDELIALFESVPSAPASVSATRIVFIVGMPRSGTTLIESVIGAHSGVLACGERLAIRWIIEDYLTRARVFAIPRDGSDTWDEWRRLCWEGIPPGHGASVVTDKNPWNFDAIGLILRLIPDARIIHVRRNPLDTGLSIYRNQFSRGLQFANRLEDIGHYYGEYARLMAHWERVAAGRFTTIQYENFIREFETAGPALLAACGLEWEPGCRRFWESRRIISTMSTMQARRPLELRAGQSGRYRTELEPLAESLRAAGVDPATGALRPEFDLRTAGRAAD